MLLDEALAQLANPLGEIMCNALAKDVAERTLTAKKAAEIEKTLAQFREGFGDANGLFAYMTAIDVHPKKAEAAIVGLDPKNIELIRLGVAHG